MFSLEFIGTIIQVFGMIVGVVFLACCLYVRREIRRSQQ